VTWSAGFTAAEGANAVLVRQTDVAGNSSSAGSLTFTLDTNIAIPAAALVTDSGSSNSDGITNIGALNVSGVEPGAAVEYSIDSGVTWTSGFTAAEGANNVLVRQTDIVSNTSAGGCPSPSTQRLPPGASTGQRQRQQHHRQDHQYRHSFNHCPDRS
jgi:hypothetical protein